MNLINVQNLDIGYEGQIVAHNINFKLEEQDYLCIVGENGSGKSTLVKTLLHLLKPISGTIELNGIKGSDIGYLPQQSTIQKNFPAKVFEVVLSAFANQSLWPFYSKEQKLKALNALEKLDITHLKDKSFKSLSGGQQQRVLLSRALLASRSILLLDEPVNGLDAKATHNMYKLIEKLNKEDGISIMMINHDLDSAVKQAKHILYLGKKVFYGNVDEFANSKLYQYLQGM